MGTDFQNQKKEKFTMDKKIRFGLIGVGAEGGVYAMFLTNKHKHEITDERTVPCPDHAALGALCDIDPAKAEMCKAKYPDIPFYTDWKELVLSGNVDAVITTVPHYLHHEMAIFCMEHGVHVLVEKPAGVRAKDVIAMNKCAEEHPKVTYGIMFNQRTHKLWQRLKEIVASGEMGEIRRSIWINNNWWRPDDYYRQSDWRATWGGEGGGILVNQAPHQLDLWQWICGIPTKVYAQLKYGYHRDINVENDVTLFTEYENGATGVYICCTHDAQGTERFEIDLDKGKIVVEDNENVTIYRLPEFEQDMNAHMTMAAFTTAGIGAMPKCEIEKFSYKNAWGFQHVEVMEDFALHILTGSPLLAPGSEGINGVNLANASHLSAWTGKQVSLPVDPEEYAAELNKHIAEEGKFPVRE